MNKSVDTEDFRCLCGHRKCDVQYVKGPFQSRTTVFRCRKCGQEYEAPKVLPPFTVVTWRDDSTNDLKISENE